MRTGRPTKPQALRELEASHHERTNSDEPKPQGVIRIPNSLSHAARRHWRRLAAVLEPLGLLSSADTDSF
jgi:phage terminase small subunit